MKKKTLKSFTIAEILIVLGIIGVIAAITIPSLISNYRKSVVETRLKAFYSNINQAIAQSEIENGDKKYWDKMQDGYPSDAEGNPDTSQTPLAQAWYEKYLKNYLLTTKIEYSKTTIGKVMLYFPDGSLLLLGSASWLFYPNAKDYTEVVAESGTSARNQKVCGTKYFTFLFNPSITTTRNMYHYNKGVEPYGDSWDGTREFLLNKTSIGCRKDATTEAAYCTKLIQLNSWKIPDDYPFNF